MNAIARSENPLHEFLRILFANLPLIRRVFLVFAAIALLLPLLMQKVYDIEAEVMVQSKKVAQTDPANAGLHQDTDKFLPPTLADMETESSILRSPELVRGTLAKLREQGHFQPEKSLLSSNLIDPLRNLFGSEETVARDRTLDLLTLQVLEDLEISPLPGSNVISVVYRSADPQLGMLFVNQLLDDYLRQRHELHSNDLPEDFYEQKKAQYQERLKALETRRLKLLEEIRAANPQEEITFRLNAINQEEQALNQHRDRQLENQRWLEHLKQALDAAQKAKVTSHSFPYTFTRIVDNVALEDREIRQLSSRLIEQISQYGFDSEIYQQNSVPMKTALAQIQRTRQQFLQLAGSRIREREKELEVLAGVIAQKKERIDEYKKRIRELQDAQSSLRQLDTETEALHQAFFTYTQRYEESRSRSLLDGGLSNARILSRPLEPSEASSPKPLLIIPLGLLTALLLALAVGYIRELFDHRFKYPTQITQQLGLPVLMTINAEQEALPPPTRARSLPWIRQQPND